MLNRTKLSIYFGVVALIAVVTMLGLPHLNKDLQQNTSAVEYVCGNGYVTIASGEQCDDGDTVDGDGCSSTCLGEPFGCAFTYGELAGTATNSTCAGYCISQLISYGYSGGYAVDADTCMCVGQEAAECTSLCADSKFFGEATNLTCGYIECGNGTLEAGEACDDGNSTDGDNCSSTCQPEVCGDGVLVPNEECDDGNTTDGDNCSSTCLNESIGCYSQLKQDINSVTCGLGCVQNGYTSGFITGQDNACVCQDVTKTAEDCNTACAAYSNNVNACGYIDCGTALPLDSGEECELGTDTPCDRYCQRVPTCGDGFVDSPEQCDDGNKVSDDGCDSSCQVEGDLYEHADDDPVENCDYIDENVCLWRDFDYYQVNNTVGNDPYSGKTDTGTTKWYEGSCSEAGLVGYSLLANLFGSTSTYLAYMEPLNWIASLFINDVYAAAPSFNPSGKYTCLHTLGSDKYYDIFWLTYGNAKEGGGDSFSYIRREFTPTCGNGVKEITELCDDSNTANGDGCDASCMLEGTYYEKTSGDTDLNNCDPVDPTVCLWRGVENQPVNNKIGNDTKFDAYINMGTHQWACGKCEDGNTLYTSTLNNLTYTCFDKFNAIPGKNTCLYIEDSNTYHDILWLKWENGFPLDGFKYLRNPYTSAKCGNGKQEAGEFCDDGNVLGGDGCSAKCTVENSIFFRNPGDATDVDVINTGVVQIGRPVNGYMAVNTFDDPDYITSTTIEWACGECSDPTTSFTYFSNLRLYIGQDCVNLYNGSPTGNNICLHDRTSNNYWDTNWLSYGNPTFSRTNQNEFSYLRSLYDATQPNVVTSTWVNLNSTTLNMTWQTPYDNGGGKIKGYKIKYLKDSQICDETAWNNASEIKNTIVPAQSGIGDTFRAYNSLGFGTFYFSIRAFDQAGNLSGIDTKNCATIAATLSQASMPVLETVTPNSIVNDTDTTVTLSGSNFSTKKNIVYLRLGTYQYKIYASTSTATDVDIIVPTGMSPGAYDISIFADDISNILKGALTITEPEESNIPVVEALKPSLIVNNVNTEVMLKGKNFINAERVGLCDIDGSCLIPIDITPDDDNYITFTLPSGISPDIYYVRVLTSDHTNNVFSPKIKVVLPIDVDGSETEAVNTKTVLDLSTFVGDETKLTVDVKLYDPEIKYINDNLSAGNLSVVIPQDAVITYRDGLQYKGELLPPRIVTNKDEIFAEASAVYDKVKDDSVVFLMGNTEETINFDHNFVITLDVISDSAVAPVIWYYNKTEDKFELAGKDGTLDGVAYTAGGTVLSNGGGIYTMGILTDHMSAYVAGVAPTITSIAPSSGSSGDSITITGTNFHTNATVTIGGTLATSSYVDTEHLTATVPSLSAGAQSVVVENPDLLNVTGSFTISITTVPVVIPSGGGYRYIITSPVNTPPTFVIPEEDDEELRESADEIDGEVESMLRPEYVIIDGKLVEVWPEGAEKPTEVKVRPAAPSVQTVVTKIQTAFKDVVSHWAESYINRLYTADIVSGKTDTLFAPNDSITRAELVKIALNAFAYNIPSSYELTHKPFPDVGVSAWYAPYAEVAKQNGIITGFQEGMRPNEVVTRVEALKILLKASGLPLEYTSTKNFTDTSTNAWYMRYIRYAYENGIVSGHSDGSFRPSATVTRAETSKMTVKLMDLILYR